LIRKQVSKHAVVARAYASLVRRLKLESSKQACLFAELVCNLSLLLATHGPFLESAAPLDKTIVRGFERDADTDASHAFSSSGVNIDAEWC
ncbi:hypothetical protein BHE74_00050945, partial [Ensete ventricosum]